jgi:ParB family transcriptional regulator, chromosome partitioning protein
MANIREQLLAKTAGIKSTDERRPDEGRRSSRTETAPGMAGALAVAQLRVRELEESGAVSEVPVHEVTPNPWQPRRNFNESKLTELAESIREVGLMQPVVVRRIESSYQLVAGERRWRAHKMLGMDRIKAVVSDVTDQDMAVLALVENVSRDDLTDYEISISVRQTAKEFPNRTRLAEAIGFSRRGLYKFLAYESLPDFIIKDLNLNPALLGSNAVDALTTAFKKHGEAGLKAAKELWPEVVSGGLDQSKFAGAVMALATRKSSAASARERKIEKFFAGNAHAGSITKDANSFTVKIKTGALSDAQETRIRQVISELFNETPAPNS